jgi:hypothetical protein
MKRILALSLVAIFLCSALAVGAFAGTYYPGGLAAVSTMNATGGFVPPVSTDTNTPANPGNVEVVISRNVGTSDIAGTYATVTVPQIAGNRVDGYAVEIVWGSFELTYTIEQTDEQGTGVGDCDTSDPANWTQTWNTANLNWAWTWTPGGTPGCPSDPACGTCDPLVNGGTPTEPTGTWTVDPSNAGLADIRITTVTDAATLGTAGVGNLGFSVANRSSQPVNVTAAITNLQGLGLTVQNTAARPVPAVIGEVTTTPVSSALVSTVYNNIIVPELSTLPTPTTAGTVARVIITIAS